MSKETENRQREPLARVIKRAEMPAGKIALLRLMGLDGGISFPDCRGDFYRLCGPESLCHIWNDYFRCLQECHGFSGYR